MLLFLRYISLLSASNCWIACWISVYSCKSCHILLYLQKLQAAAISLIKRLDGRLVIFLSLWKVFKLWKVWWVTQTESRRSNRRLNFQLYLTAVKSNFLSIHHLPVFKCLEKCYTSIRFNSKWTFKCIYWLTKLISVCVVFDGQCTCSYVKKNMF